MIMMKDMLQHHRKLKHPKVRHWIHNRKGDDFFYQWEGTKKRILEATKKKGDWTVAYMGKEYHPKEFLRKFPKYKLK